MKTKIHGENRNSDQGPWACLGGFMGSNPLQKEFFIVKTPKFLENRTKFHAKPPK